MIPGTSLSELEFRLLNEWQRDLPLTPRPYAAMAQRLDADEEQVLRTLQGLQAKGLVSRVGAVFRPHVLGWSTLAALACPAERLDGVARLVSGFPEVNHNYEREHEYNLWFVVTAASRQRVAEVLQEIRQRTALEPLDLPMLADYHIDLGFGLDRADGLAGTGPHRHPAGDAPDAERLRGLLDDMDHALAAALEDGLSLHPRPYAILAARCGMDESTCLARLERLLRLTVIRRLGVVVRHRELGYTANAMVVWDIPEERVAEAGRLLAAQAGVTLCYRRPRRPPRWPYNLFTMVHGRDRQAVLDHVQVLQGCISQSLALPRVGCQPLFSRRRFKQCGARYTHLAKAA